jgi:hypothetical protein
MKGRLDFDPEQCDYGAATVSVRRILKEWADVDWFVPPRDGAVARTNAVRLFHEHNSLARAHMPEVFPERLDVSVADGGWENFHRLCVRVRQPQSSWDWKYSALKKLSAAHSKAHGWTLSEEARRMRPDGPPRPGDLFFRIRDVEGSDIAVWGGAIGPRLDLTEALPPGQAGDAQFFLGYANMDAIECIEWQLAESDTRVEGNPFFPLTRCYAEGFYPFSLGPAEVVLFAFSES